MNDKFTPTLEYVREFYAKFQANLHMHSDYDDEAEALAEAEFDRVLAAHDADLTARLAAAEQAIADAQEALEYGKSPIILAAILSAYRPVAAHSNSQSIGVDK